MIKISGYSDDLIEIEGAVNEEIDSFDKDTYIECEDDTIVRMSYINGIWKAFVSKGTADALVTRLKDRDGDDYTDEVVVNVNAIKRWWHV